MRPTGERWRDSAIARTIATVVLLVATTGCGTDNPVAPPPMPTVDITITPETDRITVGRFVDFSTMVTYANGTKVNALQNYVVFSIAPLDFVIVPSIAPTGSVRVYGRAPGLVTLTAAYIGPEASYRGAATHVSRQIRIVPAADGPVASLTSAPRATASETTVDAPSKSDTPPGV